MRPVTVSTINPPVHIFTSKALRVSSTSMLPPLSEHNPGFHFLPWANSSPAPLQRQAAKEQAGPRWKD